MYIAFKGFILLEQNKVEAAKVFFEENGLGVDKDITYQDEQGYINSLIHIGNIYESYGDYERGLEYTQKALLSAKETGYQEGEGDAQALLGLIYTRLEDYNSAQKAYTESLRIRETSGNENAIASSLNRLAQSFCLSGDYDKALEYYTRSRSIREKIKLLSPSEHTFSRWKMKVEQPWGCVDSARLLRMHHHLRVKWKHHKSQMSNRLLKIRSKSINLSIPKSVLTQSALLRKKIS